MTRSGRQGEPAASGDERPRRREFDAETVIAELEDSTYESLT